MFKKLLIAEVILFFVVAVVFGGFVLKNKSEINHYQSLPALEDIEGITWYDKNKIIAHGGEGIDGLDYTNSKEAVENTLNNGINIIEIDFEISSDGELICYHEISDVFFPVQNSYSLQEFKEQKIQGEYTPLSGSDIFEYMRKNPDLYIVVDTKHEDYLEVIKKIADEANGDLLSRFIIQCYNPGDKEKVSNIYNFPDENYLFTAYKYSDDYNKLLKVCMDEKIRVLVVPVLPQLYDETVMELFTSKNIKVYFHTVNRPDVANFLISKGAHGIYTDFIYDLN